MLKVFLNSSSTGYLHGLRTEFGETTNAFRFELNRFEDVGLQTSIKKNIKKIFQANKKLVIQKFNPCSLCLRSRFRNSKIQKLSFYLNQQTQSFESFESSNPLNLLNLLNPQSLLYKVQQSASRGIKWVVFVPDDFARYLPHLNKGKLLRV